MHLRIGRHGDVERRDLLQAGDELGGVAVAARMRPVAGTGFGGIAAKRDDVAHPDVPIVARDSVDLLARRCNARQVRRRRELGLLEDPLDRRVGALSGRTAGPVSNRDKARMQRLESLDRLPQVLLHLLGLRREEFEADLNVAARFREQRLMVV